MPCSPIVISLSPGSIPVAIAVPLLIKLLAVACVLAWCPLILKAPRNRILRLLWLVWTAFVTFALAYVTCGWHWLHALE